jgi:hypothetical protein
MEVPGLLDRFARCARVDVITGFSVVEILSRGYRHLPKKSDHIVSFLKFEKLHCKGIVEI